MTISFVKMGLAAAALSLSFTACSDDSSSSSSGVYDVELKASIEVDEKASTITFNYTSQDYCVKNGDSYSIDKIQISPNIFKYRFFGDTLIFFKYDEEDDEISLEGYPVLVGGKAGSLYGTWQSINCSYDGYDGEMDCDDEDDYLIQDMTLRISKSSATIQSNFRYSDNIPQAKGDFIKTPAMLQLLECLDGNYTCIQGYEEDYFLDVSEEIEAAVQGLEIQKNSWKKNAANFVLNGKTVDIVVNKFERSYYTHDIALTVSINGTSCEFYDVDFEDDAVVPYCRAENEDYFDYTTVTNAKGNTVELVYEYEKYNGNDFTQCVHSAIENAPSDESVFYKKSAEDSRRQKMRDAKRKFWNAVSKISE